MSIKDRKKEVKDIISYKLQVNGIPKNKANKVASSLITRIENEFYLANIKQNKEAHKYLNLLNQ